MNKKALITIEGGLGKNVMFTALLPELKKRYEDIYILSPYYDIFKCCPEVTDAFPFGAGTLYQELVLDKDTDVLWKEPYSNQSFIKKECHLFEAWAEEIGITLEKKGIDYIPNMSCIAEAFPQIKELAEKYKKEWNKYCIVQFTGGQSPLSPMVDDKGQPVLYNERQEAIKRNYYKGQELVDLIHKEYPDLKIVHFGLKNEPTYRDTIKIEVPYLTYSLLAESAEFIVCTDSSLQHLSTGKCKNMTVIWGETRPEHFGYSVNKNICAKHVLNSQPYFKPLGVSPSIVKMPEPAEVMEMIKGKKE